MKTKTNLFLSISIPLLLIGCMGKKEYSKDECESLSMKAYRGLPKESTLFKKYCGKYKLYYTKERCQKALNDFAYSGSLKKVERVHGARISGCFNQNDIKSFSEPEKKNEKEEKPKEKETKSEENKS